MKQYPAKLADELAQELENILKYWSLNCLDIENDGFVGKRDHFNNQVKGASKGVVLNSRILWTFSAAYNFTRNAHYLVLAERAYRYINKYFIDTQWGGLFWEVNDKGEVLSGRKQIYAQGFGIYAYSEYFKASGVPQALESAISLFECIEKYSFDPIDGGYLEALARDWSMLQDFRLSTKDANEPKSMNTHLHILESYTNLLRVWPNEGLREKIRALIRIFLDKIIDPRTFHFNLFFDYRWTVRSSIVSFGHDIEGAWLLYEAAMVVQDKQLIQEVSDNLVRMVDVTMAEGSAIDGSVYNEKDTHSGHLDDDKHWWMQAEAMVGLSYAWKITGKDIYRNQLEKVWHFIKNSMIDRQNGEWFWRVDKDGIAITTEDKAGFWKCPYHNSRAMMEIITILRQK